LDDIRKSNPAIRHPNHPDHKVIIRPAPVREFTGKNFTKEMATTNGNVIVTDPKTGEPVHTVRPLDPGNPSDAAVITRRNQDPRATHQEPGGDTIHEPVDRGAAEDGRGSASTVNYNNTHRTTSRGEGAPPEITLAHELIHAKHANEGNLGGDEERKTVGL